MTADFYESSHERFKQGCKKTSNRLYSAISETLKVQENLEAKIFDLFLVIEIGIEPPRG